MNRPDTRERCWVPAPPGWVEIGAFDTDARAEQHWADMVEPARPLLGEDGTERLYAGLRGVREAVAGSGATSVGVVLTAVDDEPAVWTFSTMIEHVTSGEFNPVALVERSLGNIGRVDETEDITLVDGRTALQAFVTVTPESWLGRSHGVRVSADEPPAEMGCCVVAVALPGRPHDLVLTTGSSPDLDHRPLLAHVVSAIAAGVHVGTEAPDGTTRASGVLQVTDLPEDDTP